MAQSVEDRTGLNQSHLKHLRDILSYLRDKWTKLTTTTASNRLWWEFKKGTLLVQRREHLVRPWNEGVKEDFQEDLGHKGLFWKTIMGEE